MTKTHTHSSAATEYAPCPFCGSEMAFPERSDLTSCYVQCDCCSAQGPIECQDGDDEEMPGRDAAIQAWNKRVVIPAAAQGSVLSQIEAEARRYAGMYPQSSDGRNTFVIFADWVATLAAQPPAAPVERGCCNKCQNASECETGCKLACTCGGDPGQPASEHDISCPAGLSRISAGNGAVTEAAQFLLDRLDEFDPGEDEPEREYHGHVTPAIARLRSALTEAVPQTLPDSHLRALNEFVTLSEEDYCSDDTEEGDWAEPDDEPVAAGQDHVSCVTFGSVRRAREAIDALLALSRPQSGSGQQ